MIFTVDDYIKLMPEQQIVVERWLDRYKFVGVASLIEQTDDPHIKLVVYGTPGRVDVYYDPMNPPVVTYEHEAFNHVVIARFHYDDFPWDVVGKYDDTVSNVSDL